MGRTKRVDVGGLVYHVLNRGNGQMTIFEKDEDYAAFERVLERACERFPSVRLIAYCLMPNHWHIVLRTETDGQLGAFVGWITLTHTQRWHAHRQTTGGGHVYQGRFKSMVVDSDAYLISLCRYVERNALRAGLVRAAEEWPWSSLHRWHAGSSDAIGLLSPWPTATGRRPPNWLARVNATETAAELESIRTCIARNRPFGRPTWQASVIAQFDLTSTLTPRGRPKGRKP